MKKTLLSSLLFVSFIVSAQEREFKVFGGNSFMFTNNKSHFWQGSPQIGILYQKRAFGKTLVGLSVANDWQSWYNEGIYFTDQNGNPLKEEKRYIKRQYVTIGAVASSYVSKSVYINYSAELMLNHTSHIQSGHYQDLLGYEKRHNSRLTLGLGKVFMIEGPIKPFIELSGQYYITGPQKIGIFAKVGIKF